TLRVFSDCNSRRSYYVSNKSKRHIDGSRVGGTNTELIEMFKKLSTYLIYNGGAVLLHPDTSFQGKPEI
uniref:Uncharacterized protein n=1 Tax=Ciona intestinalis TaxID=7719 RepID=H2XPV4_CIOIN